MQEKKKMEFYNVGLLPKKLPEIISQFVPYGVYPRTPVIAINRKLCKGVLGSAGYNGATETWEIKLYPTIISIHARGSGTFSYRQWLQYLDVALHEIGHIVTYEQRANIHGSTDQWGLAEYANYEDQQFVEGLAEHFKETVMSRILQVDPRIGQPSGPLTGYPGVLACRMRGRGKPWGKDLNMAQIEEWRALKCHAQVNISDLAKQLYCGIPDKDHLGSYEYSMACLLGIIHKEATNLNIARYFVSRTGKRYLMFNASEANAIMERCKVIVAKANFSRANIAELNKALGCLLKPEKPNTEDSQWLY